MSVCPSDVLNLSCFPKTLGSEPQSSNIPDDSWEGVGSIVAIVVAALVVGGLLLYYLVKWFRKYKLQYLLRMHLFVFACVNLLPYGIAVPDEYDSYFHMLWYLSGIGSLVMLRVRLYWKIPLDITKDLDEIDEGKKKKQLYKYVTRTKTKHLKTINLEDIPPVFPNDWIPIYESNGILPGEIDAVHTLGLQLCLFRGEVSGEAFVLSSYCPHLGADLTAGGRVRGDCVQCPFHGLNANGNDGTCTWGRRGETTSNIRIKKWPSMEMNGMIYIWHHAEPDQQEPSWAIPRIEPVCNGEWIYRGRTEHYVSCHIQDIPENGADINHLDQLHSPSVFMGGNWMDTDSWLNIINHHWEPEWRKDENVSHVARISLNQSTTMWGSPLPYNIGDLELNIEQIGPATVHLHIKSWFGKAVLLQHITPIGALYMRIIHQLYTEPCVPAFAAELLLKAEAIMFERNIASVTCKEGIKWKLHTPSMCPDCPIRKYHTWYAENFHSRHSLDYRDWKEQTLEF